jgi:hypothetical protein
VALVYPGQPDPEETNVAMNLPPPPTPEEIKQAAEETAAQAAQGTEDAADQVAGTVQETMESVQSSTFPDVVVAPSPGGPIPVPYPVASSEPDLQPLADLGSEVAGVGDRAVDIFGNAVQASNEGSLEAVTESGDPLTAGTGTAIGAVESIGHDLGVDDGVIDIAAGGIQALGGTTASATWTTAFNTGLGGGDEHWAAEGVERVGRGFDEEAETLQGRSAEHRQDHSDADFGAGDTLTQEGDSDSGTESDQPESQPLAAEQGLDAVQDVADDLDPFGD